MHPDLISLVATARLAELHRTTARKGRAKLDRARAHRPRRTSGHDPDAPPRPGAGITLTGVLMAAWCLGFAAVNVGFELTGHFDQGSTAAYAPGLAVMDWAVAGLKVVGATVALLSVARRPPSWPSTEALIVLLWGAFATLALYVVGSLVEAIGMITGVSGSIEQITPASVGYVLFFLAAASGFGTLAISYYRRHGCRRALPVVGVFGAPAVLGLVLVAVPSLLGAVGPMPR